MLPDPASESERIEAVDRFAVTVGFGRLADSMLAIEDKHGPQRISAGADVAIGSGVETGEDPELPRRGLSDRHGGCPCAE